MNPNDPSNQSFQNQDTSAPQPGQPFTPGVQPGVAPQPQSPTPFTTGTPVTMDQKQPKGTRKKLIIVIALLVAIIIIAGGAYFLLKQSSPNSSSNTSGVSSDKMSSQLQLLASKGGKLQSGDLSSLDKTQLFYAVFKNAAEQNVVSITSDHYEGADPTDQATRKYEYLHQTTFDYKSKALAAETQDATNTYNERCVNGKNYTYDSTNGWQLNTGSTESCADPNSYNTNIGDGIDTGGLTATQAQAFIDGITSFSGLVTVDSMTYVTHDNAPYIRLTATVHPVSTTSLGYLGVGLFETAFDKTGLSTATWPFQTIGTLATGAKLIYYVNPATQLPAYSQIGLTYHLDDSGKQIANSIYDFQDSQYAFGGSVQPLSLTGAPGAVKLSWSEEPFSE